MLLLTVIVWLVLVLVLQASGGRAAWAGAAAALLGMASADLMQSTLTLSMQLVGVIVWRRAPREGPTMCVVQEAHTPSTAARALCWQGLTTAVHTHWARPCTPSCSMQGCGLRSYTMLCYAML